MMVFAGIGGNGASQLSALRQHLAALVDLEVAYTDENGEKGYVSDDQLKDLEGRPLLHRRGAARR